MERKDFLTSLILAPGGGCQALIGIAARDYMVAQVYKGFAHDKGGLVVDYVQITNTDAGNGEHPFAKPAPVP